MKSGFKLSLLAALVATIGFVASAAQAQTTLTM